MNDVQMLIKPVSGACNLRCAYCFYIDEMEKRDVGLLGRMKDETADALIDCAFASARRSVTFAFQGGEPTLAGLPFFERFVRRAAEKNEKRLEIHYALQTNGTQIDEAWAGFLKKHRFLVGLSLDGPKEIHDRFRAGPGDGSAFNAAMRAAQRLMRAQVPVNVLCVLTGESARSIARIYTFYKKNGFSYQQYIPCLNPLGEEGEENPFALSQAAYGRALRTLFDAYWADMSHGHYVYIRQFENYAGMLRGYEPESCSMAGHCGIQFVTESDGSVYPCDFYVLDRWRMGSVHTDTLEAMMQSEGAQAFLASGARRGERCASCRYFALCRGGCRREMGDGLNGGEPRFCRAYQEFFDYALARLRALAR